VSAPAIRTRDLTKRFGSVLAVDRIDLDVREGDIYGFLGANGSGKTTTLRLLLGLILATGGTAEILGAAMPERARDVLPRIGALVEGPAAYGHLSGPANLALFDASGQGSSRRERARRIRSALERVGLDAIGARPVKAYSLGMRQRLGLAAALLNSPRLLILDEPTNGLDPQGIREIRDLLLQLNRDGTTVFLSSHLLAEVEQLCTRVGVLDGGRLVVQEELAILQAPTGNTVLRTPDVEAARGLLLDRIVDVRGERFVVKAEDPAAVNSLLVSAGLRVYSLETERRSLEQVVLAMTGPGSDRLSAS
jgi:ABC-type multidrug transport system ATPase subunit